MRVVKTISELKSLISGYKQENKTVGLVPTMGALHAGHKSLVDRARKENDIVVVSVFVNPTQFNNKQDLATYPRTEERDCALLEAAGCDVVFMPAVEEVYPEPDNRQFDLGAVAEVMEGAHRPGHFNGVAQVVSRLFAIVEPDRAYFGEKDFQQIAVIRAMVRQLQLKVEIVPCPIVRGEDGLALSSRNALLTPEHRAAAPQIYAALRAGVDFSRTATVAETERMVIDRINSNPLLEVEYFQIVDADTLQPLSEWKAGVTTRGCVAVHAGAVRLIDNMGGYGPYNQ